MNVVTWVLIGLAWLLIGLIVSNVFAWYDEKYERPSNRISALSTSDQQFFAVMLVLFWPLAAVVGIGFLIATNMIWLAFPYARAEVRKRRVEEARETARIAERKRQIELAEAEDAIGLPDSLRVTKTVKVFADPDTDTWAQEVRDRAARYHSRQLRSRR